MRIPIVDENDKLLRYEDKKIRNPKEITRISALWVTDLKGNILLAQRGLNKKHHPGLWGPAVAGSLEEGETYESNIEKEAEEEIGLIGTKFILGPKIRRSSSHEYFCQWFSIVMEKSYPFRKEDKEVEQIKWFSRTELENLLKEKPEIFLSGFKNYLDMFK
jgi:isopentenyldiphosphate isomerase